MDEFDENVDELEEDSSEVIVENYTGERITSVLKAVKFKCLDCSANQRDEVKYCPCTNCTLWPFRLGKNPYRKKRVMSEEQRNAFRERLRNSMKERWSKNG